MSPPRPPTGGGEDASVPALDWRLLRRLMAYLRGHVPLSAVTLLLLTAFNVLGVLQPALIKRGIDQDILAGNPAGLRATAALLLAVLMGEMVCQFLFNVGVQLLGQRLLFDLRLDLFRKVLDLSSDYFSQTPVGRTMTHVTNDVEAIREFISEGIVTVVGELFKVGLIIVAMLVLDWRLAVMAFVTIPFFVLATALFRRSIRTGFRAVRQANSDINTGLNETLTGIREIKLFRIEETSRRRFSDANHRYLAAYIQTVRSYALYFPVLELVSNASMILILWHTHHVVGRSVPVGVVFAFFAYINMFFRPLRQLAETFNMFQAAMAAAERAFRLLDRPATVYNTPDAKSAPEPVRGEVEFAGVHFAYHPDAPVLPNLSFRIPAGEHVALVGHTGSGKTTIINLLNRLYDPIRGEVRLDGRDVRQMDLADLRRRLATVPQDPFLFTGSVADNISLHRPEVNRAMVIDAARQALLHPFIETLPKGYDEDVLEGGRLLSTGQRQLLSIARALVLRPALVILDEATSSVDSETEHLIEGAMRNLMAGRTAIIIAHRLSTIRAADRILVLQRGELIEDGTHEGLLARGGLYSRLYRLQASRSG